MRWPNVKTEFIALGGGLDLESPALAVSPGVARLAMNYMAGASGGFERLDGFERYSGKTSPSSATYYACAVTLTAAVAVGNTITGSTSGATGVIAYIGEDNDVLYVTKVTGTFVAENFTVGGSPKGSITAVPVLGGAATGYLNAVALNASADQYRSDIAEPTGSGSIRGIGMLSGTLYCFRNNAGGTAVDMWKATTSGWSQITFHYEVSFTAGGATEPAEGTTLTQGGVTATIRRVVTQSGAWASNTAAGRFIISAPSGGNFAAGAATIGAINVTLSGAQTAITLPAGGRYECIEYNFAGSTATKRMYGVNGVGRAFEFDGTYLVPIATGMATDTPSHIAAHKNYLFLSFRGSFQYSAVGDPYQYTIVGGAGEVGVGEDITAMLPQLGEVLAIFTRNKTMQLVGSGTSDFVLNTIAPDVGAIEHTAQNIGQAYALDDRGVIRISQSQAYGNFENATVSRLVQRVIDTIRTVAVASVTYKTRNQYRIFGSDGTGVCMTTIMTRNGPADAFTQFEYPVNVTCAYAGEDSTGKDVIFFGASNGMVYQADKGSSFDGEAIEAYLRIPFHHFKSPAHIKSFLKAMIEVEAVGYAAIRIHPDFNYGSGQSAQHILQTLEIQGGGGYWDVDDWDSFYYDSQIVATPEIKISGDGTNMSLTAYSDSDIDLGHTLQAAVIHYIDRRRTY